MAMSEINLARLGSGLDALDMPQTQGPSRRARIWAATWPKLVAVGIIVFAWQAVVWSGWRSSYLLPGPAPTFSRLWHDLVHGTLLDATWVTLRRAFGDFAVALLIGVLLGVAVARSRVLRSGIGSMVTGLQTMPSIAWFPLALLLFQTSSERAVLFVVVLGAAPSLANGIVGGIDHIPPILLRAGKVLGARGFASLRHVVLPAALPSFISGLKQGWAFAWRSLMAGELLVTIGHVNSLGARLNFARETVDAPGLLSTMVVIFVIGVVVDALVFGKLELAVRRRYGLVDTASAG
ncbi:MAG: ABC transporter permease [Actinobacteria bacterium]|nr:ABC transporter permease [Actinomycetota bacterium]